MMKKIIIVWFLLLSAIFSVGGVVEISMENDVVANTDRHYTHGTRVSYSYLLDNNLFPDKVVARSWSIGQYMYTPSNIGFETIQYKDRPYAGWLYGASGISVYDGKEMDLIEINIGVRGQWSCADETQKIIHKWIDSKEPKGWDTQLDNTLALNITAIKKYKWRSDYVDCIAKGNLTLGSIHINSGLGGLIRFGYNVPNDFGVVRMEPISRSLSTFGLYGIVEVSGRYVAFNGLLEGYPSDHVKDIYGIHAKRLVGDLDFGCGISYNGFSLIYLYNIRSKEFKEQKEHNEFGTVAISWGF